MGKKSGPNMPDAPNPQALANAQTGTNIGTALANSYLNNITQIGPDGSMSYDVDGATSWKDPNSGKTYQLPKWIQRTQLSEGKQKIYDLNQGTETELAGMAGEQAKRVRGLLSEPFSLSNESVEKRLFDLADKRYAPQRDRDTEGLRTSLANQGITQGSEAYDRAFGRLNESWNDRYNNLLLTGRGQAVQEKLTERNQPLNEISSILSGTQIGIPQFGGAPNSYGIPTTDVAGISSNNFAQQMAGYQAQQANRQSRMGMLGSLFSGLGKIAAALPTGGASIYSDERLKENIEEVGKTNDGQNIYSYNYKGDSKPQMGLIAQEVLKKHPGAVGRDGRSGFLMVDMQKALAGSAKKGKH